MSNEHRLARLRTRWSAIGAAVAITLGAGGIGIAQADDAPKPVTVTTESKRIVDTRDNLGLAGAFAKDTPRDVQVTGSVDVATPTGSVKETVVPPGATGVLVNVTVVTPTDGGFLTLRPAGATGKPTTSTVNFTTGSIEPNAATVDLSADGKIQVWVFLNTASAKADVIIDVVGYTTDHNHDDRYYTETETNTKLAAKADASALASKANSADVYTKTEADAIHATADMAPLVQTGSIANDIFVRFVGPSFSVEDYCADVDGCRVSLIREYAGTRYLYGPITFYEVEDGQYWDFAGGASGSTALGTSSDVATQLILGNDSGSSWCYFSDWDSTNADNNANFGVVHFNNTATVQTCTIKIED